jgi:hypothetical protein
MADGVGTGAGLRLRVDAEGQIALDRGEIIGGDDGVSAPDRLSTLRSERVAPVGSWFTIGAIVKLGIGVPRSTVGPIDASFDGHATAAWCEIYFTPEGGSRELILRMKDSTFHDRDALFELLASLPEPPVVERPDDGVTFETFQIGCTNNRSTRDVRMLVDAVLLDKVCPAD